MNGVNEKHNKIMLDIYDSLKKEYEITEINEEARYTYYYKKYSRYVFYLKKINSNDIYKVNISLDDGNNDTSLLILKFIFDDEYKQILYENEKEELRISFLIEDIENKIRNANSIRFKILTDKIKLSIGNRYIKNPSNYENRTKEDFFKKEDLSIIKKELSLLKSTKTKITDYNDRFFHFKRRDEKIAKKILLENSFLNENIFFDDIELFSLKDEYNNEFIFEEILKIFSKREISLNYRTINVDNDYYIDRDWYDYEFEDEIIGNKKINCNSIQKQENKKYKINKYKKKKK